MEINWQLCIDIHWLPLKTPCKILCHLSMFHKVNFCKTYRLMRKIITLKFLKFQEKKKFIGKRKASLFSEWSLNHYFMRSYWCVVCPPMSCLILCFLSLLTCCFMAFSWSFSCLLLFFINFQQEMLLRTCRLSCLSLWMLILTVKFWNCILVKRLFVSVMITLFLWNFTSVIPV